MDGYFYIYTDGYLFTEWLRILNDTKILNSNGLGLLLCEDK